ncbi:MAG: tetratricopeptide repeat protein [Rhodobacteraceae bacterium]|nr:tetratricopeptide repeat protein [Paracoccaceae bacterium]
MARKIEKSKRDYTRLCRTLVSVSALCLLAACASNKQRTAPRYAATQGYVSPDSAAARQAVQAWESRYEKDSRNRDVILGYADALRQNGRVEQSLEVLRSGVILHQNDKAIASAYGKILAMNGRFDEAINVVKGAQNPRNPDWKLLSAEAAINDQMGNNERARGLYLQALKIQPNEPSVLNNLGLSYLLSKQFPEAEYTLRKAAALPTADSRIRQNLALALGVQGKYSEAIQIAQSEIDPKQAEANIAYLRHMLQKQQS